MYRRIKIVMADMQEYDKHLKVGMNKFPNVHHIMLSNLHFHRWWMELSISDCISGNKDTLMIGVDC